jgi:hypothetical protein
LGNQLVRARPDPVGSAEKLGQEALLFVNKKKQKTFFLWAWDVTGVAPMRQSQRSFLVLFFKKELLV